MRDMNRRLALTVAGSSALVVVTAGAAVAANLGILTASSRSDVGQLDASRVAELAVATPDSIAATSRAESAATSTAATSTDAAPAAAGSVGAGGTVAGDFATVAGSAASAPSFAPEPIDDVATPTTTPSRSHDEDEDEYEYEYDHEDEDEYEGSLDDEVTDDSFEEDTLHPIESVTISDSDS